MDEEIRLPNLSPDDPERFLSPEARRRIIRARLTAEQTWRAAEVEDKEPRHVYGFVHAVSVLDVFSEEYCKIAPCLRIYQRWMRDEIDAACSSLELHDDQETELQSKYAYPPPAISPPPVDPLDRLLKASLARYKHAIQDLLARRNEEYQRIKGLSLAGGCIGRAGKRIEALVLFHKEITRLRVESYKAVADEFGSAEMLSPIRIHELRNVLKDEVHHAYLGVKGMNEQDCRAAGEFIYKQDALKSMDLRSHNVESQIFMVARTLLDVIEANRDARENPQSPKPQEPRPLIKVPQKNPALVPTCAQLASLMDEVPISAEDLAPRIGIQARTVYRHLSGESLPHPAQIANYKRVFKELLNREVVIAKVSGKRQ